MVRKDNQRMYGGLPYDGLFGDSNIVSILEQVIADPHIEYHPIDLVSLTGETPPTVRKSLKVLTSAGLLIKDKTYTRHPIYRVNTNSKKYLILDLLAYAVLDDKLGTDTVDKFIANYCDTVLREKYNPRELIIEPEEILFSKYIEPNEASMGSDATEIYQPEGELYRIGRMARSASYEQANLNASVA